MHAQFRPGATMMDAEMMAAAHHPHPYGFFPGPVLENNPGTPWSHTVPSSVPWFQPLSPFPPTVDFQLDGMDGRRPLISKRKGPVLEGDTLPNKQFISEEVMSARMNQLRISQCSNEMSCAPTQNETLPDTGVEHLVHGTSNWNSSGQTDSRLAVSLDSKPEAMIVLAPEIARIEEQPILPRSILERLQKPSMEVVLWKPPGGLVDHLIRASMCKSQSDTEKEEEYDKRTRRAQTENNQLFDKVGGSGISVTSSPSEKKIADIFETDEEMTI